MWLAASVHHYTSERTTISMLPSQIMEHLVMELDIFHNWCSHWHIIWLAASVHQYGSEKSHHTDTVIVLSYTIPTYSVPVMMPFNVSVHLPFGKSVWSVYPIEFSCSIFKSWFSAQRTFLNRFKYSCDHLVVFMFPVDLTSFFRKVLMHSFRAATLQLSICALVRHRIYYAYKRRDVSLWMKGQQKRSRVCIHSCFRAWVLSLFMSNFPSTSPFPFKSRGMALQRFEKSSLYTGQW